MIPQLPCARKLALCISWFDLISRVAGFEVHGLLIGADRSTPLDALCDEVHTFLGHWDPLQA